MGTILERFLKPESTSMIIIEIKNDELLLKQAAQNYMLGKLPLDKFGEIIDEYCGRRAEVMGIGREMKRGRNRFLDQSTDLVIA